MIFCIKLTPKLSKWVRISSTERFIIKSIMNKPALKFLSVILSVWQKRRLNKIQFNTIFRKFVSVIQKVTVHRVYISSATQYFCHINQSSTPFHTLCVCKFF